MENELEEDEIIDGVDDELEKEAVIRKGTTPLIDAMGQYVILTSLTIVKLLSMSWRVDSHDDCLALHRKITGSHDSRVKWIEEQFNKKTGKVIPAF